MVFRVKWCMIKNAHYHTPFYFEDIRKDLYMQFFRHFSYRSFLTRAVMGISALCLFASQGLVSLLQRSKKRTSPATRHWPFSPMKWQTGLRTGSQRRIRHFDGCGYRSDSLCQKYPSAGIPCQYHQNSDNIDRIRALQHG